MLQNVGCQTLPLLPSPLCPLPPPLYRSLRWRLAFCAALLDPALLSAVFLHGSQCPLPSALSIRLGHVSAAVYSHGWVGRALCASSKGSDRVDTTQEVQAIWA